MPKDIAEGSQAQNLLKAPRTYTCEPVLNSIYILYSKLGETTKGAFSGILTWLTTVIKQYNYGTVL